MEANFDGLDNCLQRSVVTDSVLKSENLGDDDSGSLPDPLFKADSNVLFENNDAEQMKELAKLNRCHERSQRMAEIWQHCAAIANSYNDDVVGPPSAKR